MSPRDAVITGIGLVSCLGEGLDQHWAALGQGTALRPRRDETSFAPYAVHTLAALNWDEQIPKRGDQRQMEPWQRTGVYAAGLALADAGLKGDAATLCRAEMIVAAGGGERDTSVDEAVMARVAAAPAAEHGAVLNASLQGDLRPTLFLAQLSNLLAGNIAIVHGVTGGSRTLMGEEAAGADAVRIAHARIAANQGDLFLVGGSYNAERADGLLPYALGDTLRVGPHAGVFERDDAPGLDMASGGCFLVIESRAHARARGARAHARIAAVATDRCARDDAGAITASLARVMAACGAGDAVVSAATGTAPATAAEAAAIGDGVRRAVATALGHLIECSFPAAVGLAALALSRGALWPPLTRDEAAQEGPLGSVLVTGCGHWRGEFAARLERA